MLNQSGPSTSLQESSPNRKLKDSTSDEALTAIVISQRERFRIRNVELENVRSFISIKSLDFVRLGKCVPKTTNWYLSK